MRNLLHGGNAHWSAPTITHFSSFEIGDATVFTVPLDLDKKLSDFHKQFPLYNVAAMTQIKSAIYYRSLDMYRVWVQEWVKHCPCCSLPAFYHTFFVDAYLRENF